jgi:hypothetical protein
MRERERDRQTNRETERQTDRQTVDNLLGLDENFPHIETSLAIGKVPSFSNIFLPTDLSSEGSLTRTTLLRHGISVIN